MNLNSNKGRLLGLSQYMQENTAEEHPVSMQDIIDWFARQGVNVNRKTVANDLKILEAFGLDIVTLHSSPYLYYVGERQFQLPELRLLMDAVAAAQFITSQKSRELLEKLSAMGGEWNKQLLERHLYRPDRLRKGGKQLYLVLDTINEAISCGKRIMFHYTEYTPAKKQVNRHHGELYVCSPYVLVWSDDRYYLAAYSESYRKIVTYRVDRIRDASILEENAIPLPKGFDLNASLRIRFKMFDGNQEDVVLECDNSVMNSVIDHFGEDVDTAIVSDTAFEVRTRVAVSAAFYSWIFQFGGKIRVKAPKSVCDGYIDLLRQSLQGQFAFSSRFDAGE